MKKQANCLTMAIHGGQMEGCLFGVVNCILGNNFYAVFLQTYGAFRIRIEENLNCPMAFHFQQFLPQAQPNAHSKQPNAAANILSDLLLDTTVHHVPPKAVPVPRVRAGRPSGAGCGKCSAVEGHTANPMPAQCCRCAGRN